MYITCWRAYLVIRMARFFYISFYGRTLFPDIRCLRITFDLPCFMYIYTSGRFAELATNVKHSSSIYMYDVCNGVIYIKVRVGLNCTIT